MPGPSGPTIPVVLSGSPSYIPGEAASSEGAGPAAPKSLTGPRRKKDPWNIQRFPIYIPGIEGEFVFDILEQELSAHCFYFPHKCNTNACRCRRTVKMGAPGTSQGRPIGFLLAWLLDCKRHTKSTGHTRPFQKHRTKHQTIDDQAAVCFDVRSLLRSQLSPDDEVFAVERDPWPGEGPEPREVPS